MTRRRQRKAAGSPPRAPRLVAGLLWASGWLAGCATPPALPEPPSATALAAAAGWQRLNIPATPFVLAAWVPPVPGGEGRLTVYLEGDGQAWRTTTQPSDDPTPRDPVALRLALADPGTAVYLARPCQYLGTAARAACDRPYWTARRYAPEVISATSAAIDELKQRYAGTRLTLVGYSGGGAVAALVAARRADVERLITVAATLDHARWTDTHAVSPLTGSLNPADAWRELGTTPQVHFVGAEDDIVGHEIASAYAARFPPGSPLYIEAIAGFDHHCCWVERWPALRRAAATMGGDRTEDLN